MDNGSDDSLPAGDDVQRVETERMDEGQYRYGRRASGDATRPEAAHALLKPPVAATWICLAAAWLFLGSKIPFTVFLGIPFDLAALLLATMCLGRGGLFTGASVLFLGTVGSVVVYLIGLFRFLVFI